MKINLTDFKQLFKKGEAPPQNMSELLKTLWYDGNALYWHNKTGQEKSEEESGK